MKRLFLIICLSISWALGKAQVETKKAIVLINGTAHMVDVTEKGNITAIYQRISNYFSSTESHASILRKSSNNAIQQKGSLVFFESESEPIPSFTEENKKPVAYGNDQYIGFSPDRALLLKTAVDQIRIIADTHRRGDIRNIQITSFSDNNFRSRSLARNRAKAINDLLIAFGVSQSVITTTGTPASENTKIDFVQVAFGL